MEETTVLIVGAGPSGLALAALLGRMNMKVLIIEKALDVDEDPRGIVISGDAVRISYCLGIGEALTTKIGTGMGVVHFHCRDFRQPAFMNFDLTWDWEAQGVPAEIVQFQPNFERELRSVISNLPTCKFRSGCEVVGRTEEDGYTIVEYLDEKGAFKSVRTSWLIGADGKRGIVRKKFLEPEGIKQELGLYDYVGTWVAINLKTTPPTPKTHPDFPLWKLGYTPEDVHSIFWPSGFHFCNDTRRPAVSGRFGPKGSFLWRHEYSVEPEDSLDDVQGDFWKQFGPWMKLAGSKFSKSLRGQTIEFPRDCIEVLRCRPFKFATQVVNRWYWRKTLLIGDAAHVFPPFGGQGIATGIRDAHSLAWRLSIMSTLNVDKTVRERILTGWSKERRQACDWATIITKHNGSITNQRSVIMSFIQRCFMRIFYLIPGLGLWYTRRTFGDFRYRNVEEGFYLEHSGGGRKIPQIWIRPAGQKPQLSDQVLLGHAGRLALVVLVKEDEVVELAEIGKVLESVSMPKQILASEDIRCLILTDRQLGLNTCKCQTYFTCKENELLREGIEPVKGYHDQALERHFKPSARYIVLRPDCFIHSVANDLEGLTMNLQKVRAYFDSA